MKKFFDSNLFYGILSVVMAIFLLFYVSSTENPINERTFTVNVAVTGLANTYLLEASPGTTEIRLSGNRSTISLTAARDLNAYVDLSNAKPGIESYPIYFTLPSGLSTVYVRPETVELSVDMLGTKELPVTCHTLHTVRDGFSYLEPVLDPSFILLSGPQRVLDQITEASITVDLSGRTASYYAELPIVLLDRNNVEFHSSRIDLSAASVVVHVEISESLSSKSVSVRTALSGNVDNRYIVAGMEVEPPTVKITGSYSAVSQIEFLNTETIDLSAMTETYHGPVRLVAPPGVSVLEGNEVEITIRIEKNLTRRTMEGIPVQVRNAPEGAFFETFPATVDVTLSAYPEAFDSVTSGEELLIDIKAYVDLNGELPGAQGYRLFVEVPEEFLVTQIDNESIQVFSQ
ncbi:MAG: CdaR family protein [Clostridiales bacterium]|nr:CdaR family protein [Clostridiales bacterium]